MNTPARMIFITFVSLLSTSCSEDNDQMTAETTMLDQPADTNQSVTSITASESSQNSAQSEPEFIPDYISVEELHERFKQDSVPFIFDVRNEESYKQSHIKTALFMPYGKTGDADLNRVTLLDNDSEIITYCGCPRHLSTLAAADLTERGYSNVKVLYEGYWHWKEQQFPVVENMENTASTTVIRFEGELVDNHEPVPGIDLFLKHARSGQLEAVRTSADGSFNLEFHLYGYQIDDQFNLIVSNLKNQPALQISADPDKSNFVKVSL